MEITECDKRIMKRMGLEPTDDNHKKLIGDLSNTCEILHKLSKERLPVLTSFRHKCKWILK